VCSEQKHCGSISIYDIALDQFVYDLGSIDSCKTRVIFGKPKCYAQPKCRYYTSFNM